MKHMKSGTVKYHLQMLDGEGKIILRKMGKYSRLFNRSHAYSDLAKTVLSHTRNETSKGILCAILAEPGVTNRELSEKFNLDKSSIHWHIERFIGDNMVGFKRDGRYKKYFLESGVVYLLNNGPKNNL
jgi:predicted transcriptional regulator